MLIPYSPETAVYYTSMRHAGGNEAEDDIDVRLCHARLRVHHA